MYRFWQDYGALPNWNTYNGRNQCKEAEVPGDYQHQQKIYPIVKIHVMLETMDLQT